MTRQPSESHFLDADRLRLIGKINGALLRNGASWIHRRKESIKIIDDTSLRRQVSVDFSLPDRIDGCEGPAVKTPPGGDPVFCPPLFVLPKSAPQLMGFDLIDEANTSLPLMTKDDNARISGATLVELARVILPEGGSISESLAARLIAIAEAEHAVPVRVARLRWASDDDPDAPVLRLLLKNPVFSYWLATLSHSSLVVVPYRDPTVRRKIFRLSHDQPITSDLFIRGRLGWTAYRVVVDSSWIDARTYHWEAEAPYGLRIAEATLSDDHEEEPLCESGSLRRVHLCRPDAQQAGAATASLFLRVSGEGFVGGALLATGLVVAALIACVIGAREIVQNPTSAPALLLLLPGLIASYVGRPSLHALTRRLLFLARAMLLLAGGVAYAAAGVVALGGRRPKKGEYQQLLDRTADLDVIFGVAAVVAFVCFLVLLIAWLLARPWFRATFRFRWVKPQVHGLRRKRFGHRIETSHAQAELMKAALDCFERMLGLRRGRYTLVAESSAELTVVRFGSMGRWWFNVYVESLEERDAIGLSGDFRPRHVGWALSPLLVRIESRRVKRRLERLIQQLDAARREDGSETHSRTQPAGT